MKYIAGLQQINLQSLVLWIYLYTLWIMFIALRSLSILCNQCLCIKIGVWTTLIPWKFSTDLMSLLQHFTTYTDPWRSKINCVNWFSFCIHLSWLAVFCRWNKLHVQLYGCTLVTVSMINGESALYWQSSGSCNYSLPLKMGTPDEGLYPLPSCIRQLK